MARTLRRFHTRQEQADDQAKIARITAEAQDTTVKVGHATAGGDERRLRGIPIHARGVAGAINGTRP